MDIAFSSVDLVLYLSSINILRNILQRLFTYISHVSILKSWITKEELHVPCVTVNLSYVGKPGNRHRISVPYSLDVERANGLWNCNSEK